MNSKYAPVVALTVLAILVIAALGYFFAIKPALGEAVDLKNTADDVRANTATIKTKTAKISEYETALAEAPPLDADIALNLPSTIDTDVYRERITKVANQAHVVVAELKQDATTAVDGWQAAPQYLLSYQIATLFQDPPIGTEPEGTTTEPTSTPTPSPGTAGGATGGYTPVVTAPTEVGPVADSIVGIPVTILVAGTPAQAVKFISGLSDPSEQLFQVFDVKYTARTKGDTAPGLPTAKEGDVLAEVTGYFYLLNPDFSVVDDDGDLGSSTTTPTAPFKPPTPAKSGS